MDYSERGIEKKYFKKLSNRIGFFLKLKESATLCLLSIAVKCSKLKFNNKSV